MELYWSLLLSSPGKPFNEQRSIFRKALGAQAIVQYDPLVAVEAMNLVASLKDFGGDPFERIQTIIAAMIIKMTYGSKIYQDHGKELTDINVESADLITWCWSQVWLVDVVPISLVSSPVTYLV